MNNVPERESLGAIELIELGARRKKNVVPAATGRRVARKMITALTPYAEWQMIVGSLRRRKPEVGDVEIIILPFDLNDLLEFLDDCGFTGGERKRVGMIDGVQSEIYIIHSPEEIGSMTLWFTGDWQFNVSMNARAARQGYKRNQYGIWNRDGSLVFQSEDERDFFDFLGMEYHTPGERSFVDRGSKKARGRGRRMGGIDDGGLFDRIGEAVDSKSVGPEGGL